jgi:hypothetical protein
MGNYHTQFFGEKGGKALSLPGVFVENLGSQDFYVYDSRKDGQNAMGED